MPLGSPCGSFVCRLNNSSIGSAGAAAIADALTKNTTLQDL